MLEEAETLSPASTSSVSSSGLEIASASELSGLQECWNAPCPSLAARDRETTSSCPAPASTRETRKRARGSPEFPVTSLMTKSCCDRKKVTCFKLLSQADIEHIRQEFYFSKTETGQTQHILNYMIEHSRGDKSVLYTVAGQEVCEVCFRMVYGLRYNRFASVKAKFLSGVVVAEHGRLGKGHIGDASIRAISWMRTFVQKVGDQMPTSTDVHLPSCLTKTDVYALAADDLCQGGLKCCKMSTFYEIWKSEFPHVKIPKESRFSKCDVCAAIKEGRQRTLNRTVRTWLSTILEKHIQLEKSEREKYAKHRHKSEKHPTKYISLIIDGMDQDKTDIPHIISNPKAMAGSYTLETHITGVRAHGHCTLMVIDCGQFHHDTNLTIEVMLRLFHHMKDCLPPVLYIQMDNTCRDNKNKYTLTFVALLVELGIFRKVKMGFLPVGHTHEDIDQLFSCISRHLKHRNALTIPELTEVIQTSFTPEPIILVLDAVVDAKGWMKDQTQALHDHLKAHQFKFERNEMGECRMFYKEWSTDTFWLPQTGLSLLPAGNSVPTQDPKILKPCFDPEQLGKIETTIRKIGAYLDKAGAVSWWKSWFEDARKHVEPSEPQAIEGTWILEEFKRSYSQPSAQAPQHADPVGSDMSGVEVVSPHKLMAAAQEFPCKIPGVGDLRTSWIGQKGVCDIQRQLAEEGTHSQVKALKSELQVLARECMQAFEAAGVQTSDEPQIRKAVDLCSSYIPQLTRHKATTPSSAIATLWKEQTSVPMLPCPKDKKVLATSILGEKLVETLMEKKQQPPDIYIGSSRATVVQNRDVVKELQVGMLVATAGATIPQVGTVKVIPPNPHTESQVTIHWMEQEKAPHKPKCLRYFRPSHKKDAVGMVKFSDILLYDFELTNKGALKKKSREYLQEYFR